MTIALEARRRPSAASGENSPAILLGEIHTGLLQNSTAITSQTAELLLGFIPHHPVRTWERPIRHALSPEVLTGVDCRLPSTSGTARRTVGTVGAVARVTAGRVLQASARTRVVPADERRRLAWSHYLARPGVLEVLGDLQEADLIGGFLHRVTPPEVLALGSVCAGLMGRVQRSPSLDRAVPFRSPRTHLRWTGSPASGERPAAVRMTIEPDNLRTVAIVAPPALLDRLPELCQDIALHDWLLSTLIALIDGANVGGRDHAEVIDRLRPAVDNLLHLWLPGARLPRELMPFWTEIERVSGFSRQWETAVHRIRDQVALAVVEQNSQRRPA